MAGIGSFEIGRTGLAASERGLYVTGHNISNINTEGYSRQQLMTATGIYQKFEGKGEIGLGVDVSEIRQLRDVFIDDTYRKQVQDLSYYTTKSNTFDDIEAILNEPMEEGLQDELNQFWIYNLKKQKVH
jgi:flagellar hook-associated protein 1 FlgK